MPGKRVQFDDDTWEAIEAVARDSCKSFQELADEAFADLLKKHKQPVGLKAALKESVGAKPPGSDRDRASSATDGVVAAAIATLWSCRTRTSRR